MAHRLWTVLSLAAFSVTAVFFGAACGGGQQQQVKETPEYQPSFKYAVATASNKADVTVGLVNPQFSGDGQAFWTLRKSDETAKAMVRSLASSFNELLIAKGFNVAGPFGSLDDMTFPEKKGSDFILYADINMDIKVKISGADPKVESNLLGGTSVSYNCSSWIGAAGEIVLIVKEPLSGEKMWQKRLELSPEDVPPQIQTGINSEQVCVGGRFTTEMINGWKMQNEAVYKATMKHLDRYVNAEEFQTLKKQSLELREKKAY